MTTLLKTTLFCAVLAFGYGNVTQASAADLSPALSSDFGPIGQADTNASPDNRSDASPSPFAPGREVDPGLLSRLRGGSDVVANDQKLDGTVATNVATNVVSGANSIASGALANVNGIPIVIQNSGANVLIQNATIINLHMQ